jgi:hypothetical protein
MSAPAFNPRTIVHQFSIQVSRRLYLDERGGVVCLGQNSRYHDATAAGLNGVLIYALIVEGVGIGYVRLAPWDAPLTLSQFLRDAWSGTGGFGYRPTILKTGPRVAAALPCLARYCSDASVELAIASATDRSYNRSLPVAHGFATQATWRFSDADRRRTNIALSALEAYAIQAALDTSAYALSVAKRNAQLDYVAATKRERMPLMGWPATIDLAVGPWLLGNQNGLAPRTPSAIRSDVAIWRDPRVLDEADDALNDTGFDGNNVIAELLPCWVESPSAAVRRIGLSVKALNWYLKNEHGLADDKRYPLLDLFGVGVDTRFAYEDGSPVYDVAENYVLFAPDKPGPVITLYERLSHGGDLGFSVALLPKSGEPDRRFRYLLFGRFDDINIIVFRSGTSSAALLDAAGQRARLINYTGPHAVSTRFYQATQQLCAAVQRAPEEQFAWMRQFVTTYATSFDQLEAHDSQY